MKWDGDEDEGAEEEKTYALGRHRDESPLGSRADVEEREEEVSVGAGEDRREMREGFIGRGLASRGIC